jgi:hypothetical protein
MNGAHQYEVLARQPLSVSCDAELLVPFRMIPDQELPLICFTPVHDAPDDQINKGGTLIWVRFAADTTDMVRALHHGMELVQEILAAFAISSGAPFRPAVPLQVTECAPGLRFIATVSTEALLWNTPLGKRDRDFLNTVALHWRELDSGHRLRRAARRYAEAIGEPAPLIAFHSAYMGLEALESPLAKERGIEPGVEIIPGKCDKCGAEYVRKRTVLAGVRAFIRGELHNNVSSNGEQDWKDLSKLRVKNVHGLADPKALLGKAAELLPAAMHYLHDASAHLGHAHTHESPAFKLVRSGPIEYLVCGGREHHGADPMVPLVQFESCKWVKHPDHGYVPEMNMNNHAGCGLDAATYRLNKPLPEATQADLIQMRTEKG